MIEERFCSAIHVTDQRVTTTFACRTRQVMTENWLAGKVVVTNAPVPTNSSEDSTTGLPERIGGGVPR
jgi:hypothetical protein